MSSVSCFSQILSMILSCSLYLREYQSCFSQILSMNLSCSLYLREYQLVVEVLDINDNSPVFDQTEYSFTVLEVCKISSY